MWATPACGWQMSVVHASSSSTTTAIWRGPEVLKQESVVHASASTAQPRRAITTSSTMGPGVRIAPDVFTLNEDLTAECAPNQPVSMADRIEHAAAACPAEAISVTRTGS